MKSECQIGFKTICFKQFKTEKGLNLSMQINTRTQLGRKIINSKTVFSNNDLILTNLFYGTFDTTKLSS